MLTEASATIWAGSAGVFLALSFSAMIRRRFCKSAASAGCSCAVDSELTWSSAVQHLAWQSLFISTPSIIIKLSRISHLAGQPCKCWMHLQYAFEPLCMVLEKRNPFSKSNWPPLWV